jgi:hypothetical protein
MPITLALRVGKQIPGTVVGGVQPSAALISPNLFAAAGEKKCLLRAVKGLIRTLIDLIGRAETMGPS